MEDSRWRIAVPAVMADGRPRLSEKKPAREVPLASLAAFQPPPAFRISRQASRSSSQPIEIQWIEFEIATFSSSVFRLTFYCTRPRLKNFLKFSEFFSCAHAGFPAFLTRHQQPNL